LDKENFVGDVNWITSGELKDHYIGDTKEKISENSAKENNLRLLPEGTFVIAIYGLEAEGVRSTGSIITKQSTISQACMAFTPKGVIYNEFLYSWYKKHGNVIGIRYAQGTKQQNLSYDIIEKFKIHYPSLKEQDKLNSFISLLDTRIATQIRIIDKLQSLMKGLNDYLQDSVPLSYSLSFSDIGEDYSGLSGKSAEDFGSGKPYITYVSIYANNFVEDDCCGKVSVKRDEKQNVVQKGDMLFTLSSETPEEVCYGAVYSGNSTETYLNSFCFGVRNREEKVFSPYMAYFFNSSRFRREVYPLAQGSTRFNLQKSDFLQKHFSYPSIDDQHRIFEILNAYDNKLKVVNQILVHYQHQKEFLLRNLFI
jgi:type I restriction enzyme S subunit